MSSIYVYMPIHKDMYTYIPIHICTHKHTNMNIYNKSS